MLKKFDMANAKPIKTLMPINGHLDLNEEGSDHIEKNVRLKSLAKATSRIGGSGQVRLFLVRSR
jgi:hypothetical protein